MISSTDVRRVAGQIGAARLIAVVAVLALALLVARWSAVMPLAGDAERMLYDARALIAAPQVAQDQRVVMVTYTDETLARTGKRSPLDRAVLARALTTLDAMGAKAIGIDILIDQPTPEDATLIAALKPMRTPTWLAYAGAATNAEQVLYWQEQFQREFQTAARGPNVHVASIRLESDRDNVVRRWPERIAGLPPLLATALVPDAAAFADYGGAIAFRLPDTADRGVFTSLPIDLFEDPAMADSLRDQIAGRYVLIGGDITEVDRFDTPTTRLAGAQVPGLEIHATMVAQMLDRRDPAAVPGWALWLIALVIVLGAAATAASDIAGWRMAALVAGQLALLVALPFMIAGRVDTLGTPAFGWLVGWVLSYSAAAAAARGVGSEQRRFAQSTLGRYLPREVAEQILREPERLTLKGERRTIYALFSDLEGFTKLTHAVAPETIAALLNRYLDELSAVVLAHGGTLDKFVGDAVVAFWGAPIARPDDGERAFAAALALAEAGERFRSTLPEGLPPVGRTRVGLHRGEAVVGNFGGEGRIQYTALGDAMNTAARLEGANKQLGTRALVSETAIQGLAPGCFRPMGRVAVRGRATPIAVFEPLHDGICDDINDLSQLLDQFDGGNAVALNDLQAMAARYPDDAALANLVYRLKSGGPGGYFVLD